MSSYTVPWIEFCHTGPISLCVDLFVCILCVFVSYCIMSYYCEHGGMDLMGLKHNPEDPIFLQCFDAVGWLI